LPRLAKEPPAGPGWIHEIKHDGFRILAELNAGRVKLITRKGFDLAQRFPLAAASQIAARWPCARMNSTFLSASAWDAEIAKMINVFGAPINPADVNTIAN
jgi:hypothetical protein